jgi:tetratricopeptide (TPR) repeat protein
LSAKKAARLFLILLLVSLPPGCSPRHSIPLPDESPPPAQNRPTPEPAAPPADARAQAASELTQQARQYLAAWDADNAINLLERAINLNPSDGQIYYYLAQAWLLKGDVRQASEFNTLAGIHVTGDPEWESRLAEQKERIERLADDP